MIAPDKPLSLFEVITGVVVFASFVTFNFCIATLRLHVDETKIRKEESVVAILRNPLPPEHILTPRGKRRVKIAKIALVMTMLSVLVIVVRNFLSL